MIIRRNAKRYEMIVFCSAERCAEEGFRVVEARRKVKGLTDPLVHDEPSNDAD